LQEKAILHRIYFKTDDICETTGGFE
jgi:hypothetical protein